MRGRGVEQFRPVVAESVDKLHRLLRRVVRQTKNCDIHIPQQLALRPVILALLCRDADDIDIAAGGELLADFESGRTRFPVDENFGDHLPVLAARLTPAPALMPEFANTAARSSPPRSPSHRHGRRAATLR